MCIYIYKIWVACTFQTLAETDGNIMHLYASSAMISATSSWADGCWFCSVLRLGMIYRAIQRRAFLGSKVISKDSPIDQLIITLTHAQAHSDGIVCLFLV